MARCQRSAAGPQLSDSIARNMKTTIDIAEPLLVEAREVSRRDGVTLRSLVEEGLRGVLEKRTAERTEYLPKVITYGGSGTCEGVDLEDWRSVRELIYETRT